jgi:four helix bundle protein
MSVSFEDLDVWRKSCRLSVDIYNYLKAVHDYALKDQICRSAVSIASNIAEGQERRSKREFIRFLRIAQGSAAELRIQLYISKEINLIPKDISNDFIKRAKKHFSDDSGFNKVFNG